MFSRLPDESVTEQEIKPGSRGSTGTARLCNHCTLITRSLTQRHWWLCQLNAYFSPQIERQCGKILAVCSRGERGVGSREVHRGSGVPRCSIDTQKHSGSWQRGAGSRPGSIAGGEWRQGNPLPSHRATTCIPTPSNQLQVPPPACKVQGCRLHKALKGSLHTEQSRKSQDFQGSHLRSVYMVIVCPLEQKKVDPIEKKSG